jgi:hypothetical protein
MGCGWYQDSSGAGADRAEMLGSWLKVAQLAKRVLEVLTLSLILTLSLKIFFCGHTTFNSYHPGTICRCAVGFSRFYGVPTIMCTADRNFLMHPEAGGRAVNSVRLLNPHSREIVFVCLQERLSASLFGR